MFSLSHCDFTTHKKKPMVRVGDPPDALIDYGNYCIDTGEFEDAVKISLQALINHQQGFVHPFPLFFDLFSLESLSFSDPKSFQISKGASLQGSGECKRLECPPKSLL